LLDLGGHRPGFSPGPDVTHGTSQDNRISVSGITYLSVIPDTECGFFLEATRPMIAAPESQTAATRSGYLGSAAATMTVTFTAGLLAASSPDTT